MSAANTSRKILPAVVLLLLLAAGWLFWSQREKQAAPEARETIAVTIRSLRVQPQAVPILTRANGYVTALRRVEVRPQVQNVVRQVHVREGQQVKAGQLLVSLDARSDQSDVARAQADVARSQAELADAETSLRRNRELLEKKFVSQAVVDADRNRVAALRSSLQAARAALQGGQVGLGHNRIHASISGRIGAINVHPGSLVQPGGDPILSIAQLDPITVRFTVPERELQHLLARPADTPIPVRAELARGQMVEGKLIFVDNAADPQSGTVQLKAQFDNPHHVMWPGTFVPVTLVTRTLPAALQVPAQAIIHGPEEASVYVVQADGTVRQEAVRVESVQEGQAVVSGLSAGARVVIEGMQNLRPGVRVQEAPAAQAAPPASAG